MLDKLQATQLAMQHIWNLIREQCNRIEKLEAEVARLKATIAEHFGNLANSEQPSGKPQPK